MPYLTPDAAGSKTVCRVLRIPENFVHVINGALYDLTQFYNWEEHGAMTIDDCLVVTEKILDDYFASGDICMIGAIQAYATTALPSGILPCNGSQYQRVDYPLLYAALEAPYIVDTDQFITPDLRGRTIIGTGQGASLSNRDVDDSGGEEQHQLTIAEMPSHDHSSHSHPIPNIDGEAPAIPDISASPPFNLANTGNRGGDQSHENMPPFRALHYGIVAR